MTGIYIYIALLAVAVFMIVFEAARIVMRARESSLEAGGGDRTVLVGNLLPDDVTRIKIIMASVLGGGFAFFAVTQMSRLGEHAVAGVLLGVLLFIIVLYVSFVLPDSVIHMLYERRLEKMNKQLVEAMNVLALALRSGRTFEGALPLVAEQIPAPLSEEFERVVQEMQVGGVSLTQALERFAERVPVKDIQIFVSTMLIVNGVGGSQADILDKNAHLIRERFRIKQKIHALTAEGRFSALSISFAPLIVIIINYLIDPETVGEFVMHPIGMLVLVAIGISDYIGYLILSKMVRIEF